MGEQQSSKFCIKISSLECQNSVPDEEMIKTNCSSGGCENFLYMFERHRWKHSRSKHNISYYTKYFEFVSWRRVNAMMLHGLHYFSSLIVFKFSPGRSIYLFTYLSIYQCSLKKPVIKWLRKLLFNYILLQTCSLKYSYSQMQKDRQYTITLNWGIPLCM